MNVTKSRGRFQKLCLTVFEGARAAPASARAMQSGCRQGGVKELALTRRYPDLDDEHALPR